MWIPIENFRHSKYPWADGLDRKVLLSDGENCWIGRPYYTHDEDGRPDFLYWISGEWEVKPTHYMPLPKLPETTK